MGFQGAVAVRLQAAADMQPLKNFVRVEIAGGLLARIGAFNLVNGDSGRITTNIAATPANETGLVGFPTFGRQQGQWLALDHYHAVVWIEDANTNAQGNCGETPLVNVVAKRINTGNLEIDLHNHGGQATGPLVVNVAWLTTLAC